VNTQQKFVDKLHTLIREGDEVDRCYAIRSLATINDPQSTTLLVECLRDDDIDVCVDAAEALGKLGGEGAAEKLLESLLNDPEGEVKTACIRALSKLRDAATIPHFIAFAEQRPDSLGYDANEWDAWWDIQLESIRALGNMQVREAVPAFQAIIEQDDFLDIENDLYKALAKIGHEGDELLLSILETGSSRARRRIVKALASSNSVATLKLMARALQDPDPDVREAVLKALPERDHAVSYLPVVLHLLKDSDADVRRAAISAAQRLSQQSQSSEKPADPSALIAQLLPLLDDSDTQVQAAVIHTLLQLEWLDDAKTIDRITALLASSQGDAFFAVCRFISSGRHLQALPDILQAFKKRRLDDAQKVQLMQTLGELGQWSADISLLLSRYLFDESKAVRLAALEAMARLDTMQDKNASPQTDQDSDPIDIILQALSGALKTPVALQQIPVTTTDATAATPASESAIDNQVAEVEPAEDITTQTQSDLQPVTQQADEQDDAGQELVEQAFKEITKSIEDGEKPQPMSTLDSMAISCVEQQMKDAAGQTADIEGQGAQLSEHDKQELKEFLKISEQNSRTARWLFSKDKVPLEVDIQRLAARMISAAGSEKAIPTLLQVYESSEDAPLRSEILLSLGELADKSGEIPTERMSKILQLLTQALTAEDRNERIAAARSLGKAGNQHDIQALLTGLSDEEVAMRIQCLNSISQLLTRSDGPAPDYLALAKQVLAQFDNNEVGVHRAAIGALLPLLKDRLNGDTPEVKATAVEKLIDAGLAGTDGQVNEMSRVLNTLDQDLSSDRLLARLKASPTSIERRFVMEMLGELYRA